MSKDFFSLRFLFQGFSDFKLESGVRRKQVCENIFVFAASEKFAVSEIFLEF